MDFPKIIVRGEKDGGYVNEIVIGWYGLRNLNAPKRFHN